MSNTEDTVESLQKELGIALDEIYALRALLAYEAMVIRAHIGLKTFPRSRLQFAKDQISRMAQAANGDFVGAVYDNKIEQQRALSVVGADKNLTRHQWQQQRGLRDA